ncbi:hypothetical protein MM239_00730 [Belliella sp. DSM 111904]|uniref:Uncharacterized protein n=1 Tax=Belliella filtrata TaxID=2923435 RepID=A0ABS9UVW8_9BACT|nr:hypothetical protein [Belliella filtrata]MCH7407905.1 hypothetical protein [Belliella filtrata]
MKGGNKQLKSIFGKWWQPVRKWFYPSWLLYELSIRFYDYAIAVYFYFIDMQGNFTSYIGDIGLHTSAIFFSLATFIICSIFLTVPACFVLYRFFNTGGLTSTQFESKIKPLF